MISEYYEEFAKTTTYKYLHAKLIQDFEEYLAENGVALEEVYNEINWFCDSLPVSTRTSRVYRTRLRRFIEYIYNKNNIKIDGEIRITREGEYHVQC